MGFALLSAWLAREPAMVVHVVEPDPVLRRRAQGLGAHVYDRAADLPETLTPQIVVLAVKPGLVCRLLEDYVKVVERGAIVLSVAAGITIGSMQAIVGDTASIVRAMPNTPTAVGAGAIVCCANATANAEIRFATQRLLEPSGKVFFVEDEVLIDAVTALSGSGPAYVFYFIECLAKAGAEIGLSEDLARALAMQTTYGASLLALRSSDPPEILRDRVTSPNGTTEAALSVLTAVDGLAPLIEKTLSAALTRCRELRHG